MDNNIKEALTRVIDKLYRDTNVVYFSINDWFSGRDYPCEEPFLTWIKDGKFNSDEWCKENKLCVNRGYIDMSINYTISASKEWVLKNCPKLLSGDSFDYEEVIYSKGETKRNTITKYYIEFLCFEDENDEVYGGYDNWPFLEYTEENFGCHWYEDPNEDYFYDDEDEEEENDEG